jgi:hypothetical protein
LRLRLAGEHLLRRHPSAQSRADGKQNPELTDDH